METIFNLCCHGDHFNARYAELLKKGGILETLRLYFSIILSLILDKYSIELQSGKSTNLNNNPRMCNLSYCPYCFHE